MTIFRTYNLTFTLRPSYKPNCLSWRLSRGEKSAKSQISERILTCCPPLNTLGVLSVSQMSSWSLYPASHRALLHSEGFSSLSAPVTGVMEVLMEARPPLLSVLSSNLASYSLPYLLVWFYDLTASAIASACLQHTQRYQPQCDIGDCLVIAFWERSLLEIFVLFSPRVSVHYHSQISETTLSDSCIFHGPEM